MNSLTPYEIAMLGAALTSGLGLLTLYLWRRMKLSARHRRSRPNTISCLLCGRRNRVTPQEWEQNRLTCRCGQSLYIAQPASHQEHPRRRL